MLFFMPMMWAAPSTAEAAPKKQPVREQVAPNKEKLASLLDKIAPEFVVTATRSALLAMTTSLTKVSSRVHGACQQLSHALAFDRMVRSMFPWAVMTPDPFDFAEIGAWFTGLEVGGRRAGSPTRFSPAPSVAPSFWWPSLSGAAAAPTATGSPFFIDFWSAPQRREEKSDVLPGAAFVAPILGMFAAMTQASAAGLERHPFWGPFLG